jgi:hypothetical protein
MRPKLKSNLTETVRSISAQNDRRWKAVIVANHGADLPSVPPQFEIKYVDFPPNPYHEKGELDREIWLDTFRFDKGRRTLAGMLHAGETGYFMVVDDDDFVSRRLTSFVARNADKNGWFFKRGYIWGDGGKLLYLYDGFSKFCGTSHIIRRDLFALPDRFEDASREYICKMLGSHMVIDGYLDEKKTPLELLPFIGAVYRIGHAGAHSKSQDLISYFFLKQGLRYRPRILIDRLLCLRYLGRNKKKEFFGF